MGSTEIWDFILHLRLNYNFLILSASFLLGAVYAGIRDLPFFIFYFLVIYVLLFGGVNAYNSYFDKDTGPIGGLKHPPKMKQWMYYAAWLLQVVGLVLSMRAGTQFVLLYLIIMLSSWAYSTPGLKLKAHPLASFGAVAAGSVTTIMGYIAARGEGITAVVVIGALGNMLVVLSMYPFSQLYQIDEDTARGFQTFAVRYGIRGVKLVFTCLFVPGIMLLAYSVNFIPYVLFLVLVGGLLAAWFIWKQLCQLHGDAAEYKQIMKTKYYGGLMYTMCVIAVLIFERLNGG